jgi:plasmid stability protein
MEDEAKEILQAVLNAQESRAGNLAAAIRRRVMEAPAIEAQPLSRQKMKAPPEFD